MNHVEFKSILFKSELEIGGKKYQGVISTTRDENKPENKQSISLGKGKGENMVVMERVDRDGVVQISGRAVGVNEDQIGTFSKDWLNTVTDAVFGNEEDHLFDEEEEHMEGLRNEQDKYKEEKMDTHDSENTESKRVIEETSHYKEDDIADEDAAINKGLEEINIEEIKPSDTEESKDTVKQKTIDVDAAICKEMKEENTVEESKQGGIEWIEEDDKKNAMEEVADKDKAKQMLVLNNKEKKEGSEEAINQKAIEIDDYINKQMEEENTQNLDHKDEVENVSQDTEMDLITEHEVDNADTLGDFEQENNKHNLEFNSVLEREDGHTIDGNQDLIIQENDDCEMEDMLFVELMIKEQLQPFQDILQHFLPHFFVPQH